MRTWRIVSVIGLCTVTACSESPTGDYTLGGGDATHSGDSTNGGDVPTGDAPIGDAPLPGDGFCAEPMCAGPACPGDTWIGLDGCPSCACAPPVLSIQTYAAHPMHVSFSPSVTQFIGGIDRWIFDFQWDYDDPGMVDEAETVTATVGVMHLPSDPITSANLTAFVNNPLEPRGAQHVLHGVMVTTTGLTFIDGFLSVRRNGSRFEGGVYLELETLDTAQTTMTVAGSFDLPAP